MGLMPSRRALGLATVSFGLCFAAWGLIGGLAPVFTEMYRLSAAETALLVAVPVLLGSVARLPMGMLTDRFGGRLMFAVLLAVSSLAAWIVPLTTGYRGLLVSEVSGGRDRDRLSQSSALRRGVGIVQDPRITPVARTCDLYLPVKPGRDAALFAGVLQIMIERGWTDRDFITQHTSGFDQVAEYSARSGRSPARPRSPACRSDR